MSDKVWFDPTSDKWALSDGEHYLEVPHWAREIIVNEFERETRQLRAQNAMLRELVKDLYEDMWASGEWLEPYEQRMRELGIEVD